MITQLDLHSAKRVLSAFEVCEMMEMGLCIVCGKPFTDEHQSAHKNIRLFVIDNDEDEIEHEEADQPLSLSSATPFTTESAPFFLYPLRSDDEETQKSQGDDKPVADPVSEINTEMESVDTASLVFSDGTETHCVSQRFPNDSTPFSFVPPLTGDEDAQKSPIEDHFTADPASNVHMVLDRPDQATTAFGDRSDTHGAPSVCSKLLAATLIDTKSYFRYSAQPPLPSVTSSNLLGVEAVSAAVVLDTRMGPFDPGPLGSSPTAMVHTPLDFPNFQFSLNTTLRLLPPLINPTFSVSSKLMPIWLNVSHRDDKIVAPVCFTLGAGNVVFSFLDNVVPSDGETRDPSSMLYSSDFSGAEFFCTNWQVQDGLQEQVDTIKKNGSVDTLNKLKITLQQVQDLAPELHHVPNWNYIMFLIGITYHKAKSQPDGYYMFVEMPLSNRLCIVKNTPEINAVRELAPAANKKGDHDAIINGMPFLETLVEASYTCELFSHGVIDNPQLAFSQDENYFVCMVEQEMGKCPALIHNASCVLLLLLHVMDLAKKLEGNLEPISHMAVTRERGARVQVPPLCRAFIWHLQQTKFVTNVLVFLLTENGTKTLQEFVLKSEAKKKAYPSNVAVFDMVMQTMKSRTHDSESSLREETCLLLGDVLFPGDKGLGVASPISLLIAILAAFDAFSHFDGIGDLIKQLVFVAVSGGAWVYLGNWSFLMECDTHSDAVYGLNYALIETLMEVGSIEQALRQDVNHFFAHAKENSSTTSQTLVTGKHAQELLLSGNIRIASAVAQILGIPPSSLMTFLNENPRVADVVLEEFVSDVGNKSSHNHFEDFAKAHSSVVIATVSILHRKMINWGSVLVTIVMLKWRDLPPKHGTWEFYHYHIKKLLQFTTILVTAESNSASTTSLRFLLAWKRGKYVTIFHRKMIPRGSVRAAKILLKWKALPLKHGTWKYSSLRTRMLEGEGIVTVFPYHIIWLS